MNRWTFIAAVLGACVVGAGAMGINAAMDAPRTLMSPAVYADARKAIENDVRAALGRCRGAPADAREVCKAEAHAQEHVRRAELDAAYYGTTGAVAGAKLARAKARYDIAKARCAGRGGAERLQCIGSARAQMARETEKKLAAS